MVTYVNKETINETTFGKKKFCLHRDILIVQESTLRRFNCTPQDLNADIVVSDEIYNLPSGSVIRIGCWKLRLTFHCEPCGKIKHLGKLKDFVGDRGYLCEPISEGTIRIGDMLEILSKSINPMFSHIAKERVINYLESVDESTFLEVVKNCGLSKSYCRSIPSMIRNRKDLLNKIKQFFDVN
jgi:MOSC domain-containing protein YiiM